MKPRKASALLVVLVILFCTRGDGQGISSKIKHKHPGDYNAALLDAIEKNDFEEVRKLHKLGADLNYADKSNHGAAVMHRAAASGTVEMIELLHALGADIYARGDDKATPLHLAAFFGNVDAVEALVKLGADIHAIEANGCDLASNDPRM